MSFRPAVLGDTGNPQRLFGNARSFPSYYNSHKPYPIAAGANLFSWRKVFDEVGLFDERLLNLGDKDWGQWVHSTQWGILFSENAVVCHPARATLKALMTKAQRQTRANHRIAELKGEQLKGAIGRFLPLGLNFFKSVLGYKNLKGWRDKLAFVYVIYRVKWAIALQTCG